MAAVRLEREQKVLRIPGGNQAIDGNYRWLQLILGFSYYIKNLARVEGEKETNSLSNLSKSTHIKRITKSYLPHSETKSKYNMKIIQAHVQMSAFEEE